MKLTIEQAKKLAEEINALAPRSARVVSRDGVDGNQVVERLGVEARIADLGTGNGQTFSSFSAPEGAPLDAAKIVAAMKKKLAASAKQTRAAIRSENEEN